MQRYQVNIMQYEAARPFQLQAHFMSCTGKDDI
jgi:hypothetical protein